MTRDLRSVEAIEALLERRAQRRRLVRFGKAVLILLVGVGVGALLSGVWR